MMDEEQDLHWLVRPSTIRKLWLGFYVVLALTLLAQVFIYVKGYFGVDAWFGFGAVYGFVSCLAMVVIAKLLGFVLKRPLAYYDTGSDKPVDATADEPDARAGDSNDV